MMAERQQTTAGGIDEYGDKDKKKKRRSNRRSKQNSSLPGSACNSVSEQHQGASKSLQNGSMPRSCSSPKQHGPNKDSNVAFNSLPAMHIGDQTEKSDTGIKICSKSCPTPISFEESVSVHGSMDFVPFHLVKGYSQQKYFDPHWPLEVVNVGLQNGEVFQATFCVNAHNRLEAYCAIDGVPVDVLISGIPMQNRAVEGDIVAVKVYPPALWSRMKGSAGFSSTPAPRVDNNLFDDLTQIVGNSFKGKNKVDVDVDVSCIPVRDCSPLCERGFSNMDSNFSDGTIYPESTGPMNYSNVDGHHPSVLGSFQEAYPDGMNVVINSVEKLREAVISFPSRRPIGRVVAIIELSPRRDAVVGFLNVKQWLSFRESCKTDKKDTENLATLLNCKYIQFSPTDPKFPKMMVLVGGLPECIQKRLDGGDATIEMELVAARIEGWEEESPVPQAYIMHTFGPGGEVEPQIAAILFENAICSAEFSPESLSCLPRDTWVVTQVELESRTDIRNLCVFTIDPSTSTDLDDALSVERLSGDIHRVGVHIADVSYFVQPDTQLDREAHVRSTSVYTRNCKLPMLPPLLSENLGSLIPGIDRLAFSIFWKISLSGIVVDRWIGRTVVRSCCKLSYEHAQDIIDGQIDADSFSVTGKGFPPLHGNFQWQDIIRSVRNLHEISKALKEKRFNDGALLLESSKISFLLDDYGIPYDSMLSERKDSNFLVEEFMLLANRTAAEIISRTFPYGALLRRHPEPNMRKLREFEVFCSKHGLELDASSSGSFQRSLDNIREKLKDDMVLYDILISYASRPLQVAKYFCSGDIKVSENDWSHYALAVPLYTHFTSPLRRYPDIVVHRTLAAAIEAEYMYLKKQKIADKVNHEDKRCFTGICFDKLAAESAEGQQALSDAALKHGVPCTETLSDVAAYCNKRESASRRVKDAVDRLYTWVLLKHKEFLISEARVLGLGPRFMSIYIHKLAIERRIYYDEVEGMMVEWFEATSTVVLSFCPSKRFHRRGSPGKFKALDDVAWVVNPCDRNSSIDKPATQDRDPGPKCQNPDPIPKSVWSDLEIDPPFFPLTVRLLSTIPVALHAVGGEDGPLDIAARLYMSSYLR
ncbi:hypothetical protein Nepgr_002109 [Nepenthes gracilis]|uniref:DIS3-like exonuclease 2 n=1 Tax=Nepenthes gracilis TaxID=150966 RepID=A0AAD3P3F1_NEPGR|nr:hypothetical protein Nepgr_002109 [Nepenthes gracilis]